VRGKFFYVGEEKLYVRGVTYGAFKPDGGGNEYHDLAAVERDFALMAANGVNAVRIPHTMPPRSLLDAAERHGLRVMVGLSAEQYVGYLIDRKRSDVEGVVRRKVRACAGHPAVLCYAIGNEIPAPLARWLGHRRVERYLERLYDVVKTEDPHALVTYVNYPSTEYLDLPFLDVVCFNVYLEVQARLEAYLARLQNLAGDRPLLLGELGLDSLRNGEETQAHVLDWQLRTAFGAGCAGAFVFAWTDEWYRGGGEVDDWAFGVTDRQRRPKPALAAVSRAFREVPFPSDLPWPRVSVVVCSYNGARTIRDTLDALSRLDYPDHEVIVVDDGSTDATAAIASSYAEVRVITTENRGLSSARNTGLAAATGEIVAYTDDDAYPDPHWLRYLAAMFMKTGHAAVGGPNIPPPGDGPIAACVANAPGGPAHVLLSDQEAEHLPGCNLAIRKVCLEAIGGFDPQFRVAGDDVDVCWRLRQRGWTLGFSPAAVVWHHRRNSLRAYWRQQVGYGKAESLLERKWPEKYNAVGHLAWAGRAYSPGLTRMLGGAGRIYHGVRGSAPFQSVYSRPPALVGLLPQMPEWYLVVSLLAALSVLSILWRPLLLAVPLLAVAIGALVMQSALSAARARFTGAGHTAAGRRALRTLTAVLHLVQPMARLRGRLQHGLTPWRRRGLRGLALPWPRTLATWSERWEEPQARLDALAAALSRNGAVVLSGGPYDRWDLEVRGGALGTTRVLMAVEDHGSGTQFVRLRVWPRCSPEALGLGLTLAAIAIAAARGDAWSAALLLGLGGLLILLRCTYECAASLDAVLSSVPMEEPVGTIAVREQRTSNAADPLPEQQSPLEVRRQTIGADGDG
jgi:GT2 family glycosyltransferase